MPVADVVTSADFYTITVACDEFLCSRSYAFSQEVLLNALDLYLRQDEIARQRLRKEMLVKKVLRRKIAGIRSKVRTAAEASLSAATTTVKGLSRKHRGITAAQRRAVQ